MVAIKPLKLWMCEQVYSLSQAFDDDSAPKSGDGRAGLSGEKTGFSFPKTNYNRVRRHVFQNGMARRQ